MHTHWVCINFSKFFLRCEPQNLVLQQEIKFESITHSSHSFSVRLEWILLLNSFKFNFLLEKVEEMDAYSLLPLLVGEVGAAGGLHAFVLEDAHIDLQREEREHHQAEHGQRHHLHQLLDAVQQRVDDGLQAWNMKDMKDMKDMKNMKDML